MHVFLFFHFFFSLYITHNLVKLEIEQFFFANVYFKWHYYNQAGVCPQSIHILISLHLFRCVISTDASRQCDMSYRQPGCERSKVQSAIKLIKCVAFRRFIEAVMTRRRVESAAREDGVARGAGGGGRRRGRRQPLTPRALVAKAKRPAPRRARHRRRPLQDIHYLADVNDNDPDSIHVVLHSKSVMVPERRPPNHIWPAQFTSTGGVVM